MGELLVSAALWGKVVQEPFYIYEDLPPEPQKIERRVKKRRTYSSRSRNRSRNKTTLIFAPHPDDEILCCSSIIGEKVGRREKIKVVVVTDGDAYEKDEPRASKRYGLARRTESRKAAKKLGLKDSDVIFLGFPDGVLSDLNEISLKSPYTYFSKTPRGSHVSQIPYTRKELKKTLTQVIDKNRPKEVYIPSQEDRHPDHKMVGEIVKEILFEKPTQPKIYEYVVHQPKRIIAENAKVNWKKLNLIKIFESQFHDRWHREFLEQFARIPEKFNLVKQWNQTARR